MPLVKVPEPTFVQKLKRFFMLDLVKGLGLTLKYNVGAITDRDAVGGKGIYTEQYPKDRPDVAPRFHGAPRLNMDPETHDTLCIAGHVAFVERAGRGAGLCLQAEPARLRSGPDRLRYLLRPRQRRRQLRLVRQCLQRASRDAGVHGRRLRDRRL